MMMIQLTCPPTVNMDGNICFLHHQTARDSQKNQCRTPVPFYSMKVKQRNNFPNVLRLIYYMAPFAHNRAVWELFWKVESYRTAYLLLQYKMTETTTTQWRNHTIPLPLISNYEFLFHPPPSPLFE